MKPRSVTLNSGGEIYRGSDYIPTPDISKLDSAIIALNESKPKEDLKTRLSKLEKAVKNIKSTLSAQILIMKTQNRYNVDSIFIEIRGATLRASTLWIDGETYHLKEQCYPMKTRYDYELLNKGEFYFVKNTGKEDKIKLGDLLLFEPLYNAHNDNYAPSDTVLKLAKNFFSGGNCISLSKERAANYFRINLYSDFLALFFQRPNSVVQTEALFYCYMNTKHGFSFSGNVRDKTGTRTGREKWLYFNSIFPILNVAKFDNSISKLNVLYGSYPKENDTVAHANALDIYHFSYLKMGLGINIISHYIREWSTYTYFNYEPMVLLTTMHDSIPGTKDLARVYDLTSWANKFELVFKVRQDRTWGLNAGFSALQLKVQKRNNISPTYSQVYGQPVKDNIYNPLPYPGNYFGQHIIDPNSMIYSSEVEFFYSTNSANSSRIYLKMRYTTLRLRTDGYPEILVGYSADIRSIKFK